MTSTEGELNKINTKNKKVTLLYNSRCRIVNCTSSLFIEYLRLHSNYNGIQVKF